MLGIITSLWRGQEFKSKGKAPEDMQSNWTKAAMAPVEVTLYSGACRSAGGPGTGREVSREAGHTQRTRCPDCLLQRRRAFCSLCICFSGTHNTSVSQYCVGGVKSQGSGLRNAVPPVRFLYISYEFGIVLPSIPEAGCPEFRPGHCIL